MGVVLATKLILFVEGGGLQSPFSWFAISDRFLRSLTQSRTNHWCRPLYHTNSGIRTQHIFFQSTWRFCLVWQIELPSEQLRARCDFGLTFSLQKNLIGEKKKFCLFILFCSINEVWRKVTLYAILYLIEANFWAKRFGKQFGVTSSTSLCSLLNISGRKRVCTSTEVRSWII